MISTDSLRGFPSIAKLEPAFIQQLAEIGEEMMVQAGTWLFHEGDQADAMYLVVSGDVDLKLTLDEKRQTHADLNTLRKGDTVGWSAIVQPHIYRLGAVTASNSRLIKLDGIRLRALMEEHPEQGYIMMQEIANAMASRLNDMRTRVPDLSLRFVLSRIFVILAFITGILNIFLGTGAIVGGDEEFIPLFLVCFAIPAGFLVLARWSSPVTHQR